MYPLVIVGALGVGALIIGRELAAARRHWAGVAELDEAQEAELVCRASRRRGA